MSRCKICDQKAANCDCTKEEREQYDTIEELQAELDASRQTASKETGYVAQLMRAEVELGFFGRTAVLPVSGLAPGCVGVLLVFDTLAAARDFAGRDVRLQEIEYVPISEASQ